MSNCPDHSKEIPKLNRVIGQLEGIKKMIGDERYCNDIITQLMAARSAIRSISGNMLKEHLQCCVAQSFTCCSDEAQVKIDEVRKLFDKFE